MQIRENVVKLQKRYEMFMQDSEHSDNQVVELTLEMLDIDTDTLKRAVYAYIEADTERDVEEQSTAELINKVKPILVRMVYGALYSTVVLGHEVVDEEVFKIPELVPNQVPSDWDKSLIEVLAEICTEALDYVESKYGTDWWQLPVSEKGGKLSYAQCTAHYFYLECTEEGFSWLMTQSVETGDKTLLTDPYHYCFSYQDYIRQNETIHNASLGISDNSRFEGTDMVTSHVASNTSSLMDDYFDKLIKDESEGFEFKPTFYLGHIGLYGQMDKDKLGKLTSSGKVTVLSNDTFRKTWQSGNLTDDTLYLTLESDYGFLLMGKSDLVARKAIAEYIPFLKETLDIGFIVYVMQMDKEGGFYEQSFYSDSDDVQSRHSKVEDKTYGYSLTQAHMALTRLRTCNYEPVGEDVYVARDGGGTYDHNYFIRMLENR